MIDGSAKIELTSGVVASRSQAIAEVLLIVMVFYVAAGDAPPNVNESHYLCRLKHYWDPGWCPGDLFLQSQDTQLLFIWLFGWVTRIVSLAATAWIGRIVCWVLMAFAWQRFSWRLVPRRYAAVLSAALFVALNTLCNFAGEWVVGGIEAKCFAYAFVLIGLAEMVAMNWNAVWFWLGIATAFHPLVGGWSGVVCMAMWLIYGRRDEPRLLRLPGFWAGGMFALIGIGPALLLTRGVPAETVTESIQIYVFDRLPHHLAPLTLPSEELSRRVIGHVILIAALAILSLAARVMFGCESRVNIVSRFAWGAATIAAAGLCIEVSLASHPELAAKLLRYYWFRLTDFAAAMAVAILLLAIVASGFDRRRWWAIPGLLAALGFAGWFLGSVCWARYVDGTPPADRKAAHYDSWVDVCGWVAEHTPPNALFLTPRLNCTFKWRSGRPEVVNRKDIPQDAAGIVEWNRRLKDIFTVKFAGQDQNIDSVGALGDQRVRELAKQYHANYVLSDRAQLLKLPVVYRNEEYVVYKIGN